ncbi:MAG TPA: VWA domain-containing protein [Pyrinomonadaceae bacterium]|jgi:VWFA-related protein
MKKITVVAGFLLALIYSSSVLYAQSGRNRSGQSINSSGSTTAAPDATDSTIVGTDGQGETVEGDVLRIDTTLVTVPFSVKDRNGRYIPDLRREDFRVFEEGVEQKITYFATVDQPFTVVLVIDTSNSTNFKLEDIQDAAIAFVNQLRPEDRVMVVSFDDSINVLSEPTNDFDKLTKAIRRTRTGGGTRLYDAVDQVINKHLKRITGRKAVVLFTDGVDTTSRRATYESTVRDAEELDALIYPVAYDTRDSMGSIGGGTQIPLPGGRGGIIIGTPFPRMPGPTGGGRGGGTTQGEYRRASAYLSELAQKTGGRVYNGSSRVGLSQAFAWVAEELRRQYSLGYYPRPQGQEGQRRQIKVRVNQPSLVVNARDSYIYSQKKTDATGTKEPPTKTDSQGRQLRESR